MCQSNTQHCSKNLDLHMRRSGPKLLGNRSRQGSLKPQPPQTGANRTRSFSPLKPRPGSSKLPDAPDQVRLCLQIRQPACCRQFLDPIHASYLIRVWAHGMQSNVRQCSSFISCVGLSDWRSILATLLINLQADSAMSVATSTFCSSSQQTIWTI